MSPGAGHALDASVLVLNKFYMAVHVISVRRAFCLLFKNLAEVITVDDGRYVAFNFASWREVSEARALFREPDDDFIRTVHFEIQVPRIIRLLMYDRMPRQTVKFIRPASFLSTTSFPAAGVAAPSGTTSFAPACSATCAKAGGLRAKPG